MLRKQKRRRPRRQMSEINVVPYIDVMLVLLVIFIVTTPLLTQGVKITLPQAKTQALTQNKSEPMIISVDKQGRYYVNLASRPNDPIAPQILATRVAAQVVLDKHQHISRQILIKGDSDVSYNKVVQAMALVQNAGVSRIGLMTEPLPQQSIG